MSDTLLGGRSCCPCKAYILVGGKTTENQINKYSTSHSDKCLEKNTAVREWGVLSWGESGVGEMLFYIGFLGKSLLRRWDLNRYLKGDGNDIRCHSMCGGS